MKKDPLFWNKVSIVLSILLGIGYITLGTWSSIQILSWFGKSIPLLGNLIIGFFTGTITIPIAIVGMILRMFGVF